MAAPEESIQERPELSLRALVVGAGVGTVLALGNVYMGLKTGWADSGSITAAIAGAGIMALFPRRGAGYSPLENNITQTVASSAAFSCFAAGLVAPFPALHMAGIHTPFWSIALWGMALAVLGTFLGVALRDRLIVSAGLPFPGGTATAEVIGTLHAGVAERARRVRALVGSAGLAAFVTWFRDGRPALIPALTSFPGTVRGISASSLGLGVTWSPMLLGVGALIGLRSALSLLLGGLIGWVGLAPGVAQHQAPANTYEVGAQWLVWPGVSLLIAAALTSLLSDWRLFLRGLRDLARVARGVRGAGAMATAAVGLLVLLGWAFFALPPLLTLLSVVASLFLATVCARAAGETNVAPINQLGQVTQISFASLSASTSANVLGASVVTGTAAQTALMLDSFKAGHLLGSNPQRQTLATLLGCGVGVVVCVASYAVLLKAYALGSPTLPAPSARAWLAVSQLARPGQLVLAGKVGVLAAGASGGILLTLCERWRWARLLPSPIALGVGFLVPASYSATIALGAVAVLGARRVWPSLSADQASTLAAGAIAGEALMGFVVAVLLVAGILA